MRTLNAYLLFVGIQHSRFFSMYLKKNELLPRRLFSTIAPYLKYTEETKNSRDGSFLKYILVKPVSEELKTYLI